MTKRWHYIVLSALSVAAILALLVASEQRAGLLGDLEAENAYLQRRLDQSMKQIQQLTDRIVELEANRPAIGRGARLSYGEVE